MNDVLEKPTTDSTNETVTKDNVSQTPKQEIEPKKTKKSKKRETLIVSSKEYTAEEFVDMLRKKYMLHDKYYKFMLSAAQSILDKENKQLDKTIEQLTKVASNIENLSLVQLEKYTIQIPLLMYQLNERLSKKNLAASISNHLNQYEISSKLFNIRGGSANERQRAAEYQSMFSTFTYLITNYVTLSLKSKLDMANKVNDGVKKVLTAQIEEMKLNNKTSNYMP